MSEYVIRAFAEGGWESHTDWKRYRGQGAKSRKMAVVYGVGNSFRKAEKVINDKYQIIAFADANRKGLYAGIDIIKPSNISKYMSEDVYLIITLEDKKICREIEGMLVENYSINRDKVVFFADL